MTNSWDRLEERKQLWFHFKQGRNISLFAPRRLGKSWLMNNLLKEEANTQGWTAVYSDIQNANSYSKAIEVLLEDIQENQDTKINLINIISTKLGSVLSGEFKSFKDMLVQMDHDKLLDTVLSCLNENTNRPTLILLDEVTVCASMIMKKSTNDAFLLLNTLRKLRDRYPNIRWMLTGSIGIEHFTKQHKAAGAFNNLDAFLLEPFNPSIATDFVNNFCQNKVIKPFTLGIKIHSHLQKRLGWLSPYYLEKLCLRIDPSSESITKKDIDTACKKIITHPHHTAFEGWPDHIARNVPSKLQSICNKLLGKLSENKTGESLESLIIHCDPEYKPQQIKEALTILVNDGFLTKNKKNKKYHFVMQLLADYWQEYQS